MDAARIALVFGTRPEAIKMAPVVHALQREPRFDVRVIVTAQHRELLDQVLEHFEITPDHDLNLMKENQGLNGTAARIFTALDRALAATQPDWVLVHGDTLTAFAGAVTAFHRQIATAHVEAGLRTQNKWDPFPEEMYRQWIDQVADIHFAPTSEAAANLEREGRSPDGIVVTGNTAIDALLATVKEDYAFASPALKALPDHPRLILAEVHRRENHGAPMESIAADLARLAAKHDEILLVCSVHPNPNVGPVLRRVLTGLDNVLLVDPVDYPDWANLMARAWLIITDSGGIQEEAPSLGVPVLLTRNETERPEALQAGTVRMVGTTSGALLRAVEILLQDPREYVTMSQVANPYGDGQAAERMLTALQFACGLHENPPLPYAPDQPAGSAKGGIGSG